MFLTGIIWATIISVPFWLILIFFVGIGPVFLSMIILGELAWVGLILYLYLTAPQITTIRFPIYEFRHVGDYVWHIVSEKEAMERIVDGFDPVTPAIARILRGEEIIVSNEIYGLLSA